MRKKIYDIQDCFDFGRNKGKTIEELLIQNPGYVDWAIRNIDNFALSHEAFEQAKIITAGKKLPREDSELAKENPVRPSLFKKLYGWSYDFSKEEILHINIKKINEINSKMENAYSNHGYHDDTDWSHYNDDVDMDQQSEDFWNQY